MRRAFTLVEAMIATALSALVVTTAWAAFRLCTDSARTATRLSLENALMREGVSAALDQLDTWRNYDDPDDATRQPLRRPGSPFAPLDLAAAGFDTDERQSDPKTWFRGIGGSEVEAQRWGRYELHAGLGYTDPNAAQQYERRWTANLIRNASDALGYYAMQAYAPPGQIMLFYDADGTLPHEFWDSQSPPWTMFASTCAEQWTPRDDVGFCLIQFAVTLDPAYWPRSDRQYFWGGYYAVNPGAQWQATNIDAHCGQPVPLAPMLPAHWPALDVRTYHLRDRDGERGNAIVSLASPDTGQRLALYLSAVSTTIRGARMQRGLDANAVRP